MEFPDNQPDIYIFGLARYCDENSHEAQKALVDNYEASYEKQESLNEVTTSWKNFRIKDTSQNNDICFNELYNLSFKFKKIKEKYEKDNMKLRHKF